MRVVTVGLARHYLQRAYPKDHTPTPSTIRCWITRGKVRRTEDGGIDLESLDKWFAEERNKHQANRRAPRAVAV